MNYKVAVLWIRIRSDPVFFGHPVGYGSGSVFSKPDPRIRIRIKNGPDPQHCKIDCNGVCIETSSGVQGLVMKELELIIFVHQY